MDEQHIQRGFTRAGWQLDGSFLEHLVVGYTQNLSILAYPQAWQTEGDLRFQLLDHEDDLCCWVREIVTPGRVAQLLLEYGEPVTEEEELRA